jgi:hypothetical protein
MGHEEAGEKAQGKDFSPKEEVETQARNVRGCS